MKKTPETMIFRSSIWTEKAVFLSKPIKPSSDSSTLSLRGKILFDLDFSKKDDLDEKRHLRKRKDRLQPVFKGKEWDEHHLWVIVFPEFCLICSFSIKIENLKPFYFFNQKKQNNKFIDFNFIDVLFRLKFN